MGWDEFAATPRFDVLRCIGTGGMGTVYEAVDKERNARVALKTLHAMNGESLLRFKKEFRDFQNLQHPNLVTVGELFSDGAEWFFSMELIDGTSFLEYVRSPDHVFDEARLRDTAVQLAEGLIALHEAHKVHCDIKPSNVLVTPEGRVVLLDFGLAADIDGREHRSEVEIVGTIEYMAPEQAAGRQLGPAADWYAMGVVLFEALTGEVPFSGAPMEVLMNKQRLTAPSPRSVNPRVPHDLDVLCAELLRFNPSERPTGASVLARLGAREPAKVKLSTGPVPGTSLSAAAPFVGRERELQELRELFDRSRQGAQIVALHGESGVGKSALVRRFVHLLTARDPSVAVLQGTCYERESVPFKAVDGMIDSLSQYLQRLPKPDSAAVLPRKTALLAQVFPVLRRIEAVVEAPPMTAEALEPREQRARLFAALRELFQRLADRRPLVIVIDDMQWADADSLALLSEVLRAPDSPCLLLIATVRTFGGAQAELPELGEMRAMQIERLSPAEGRELATSLISQTSAPAGIKAHQIAQEAAGHPLFIHELIRHACATGTPHTQRLQLEEALWARISQLGPEARTVLELVSIADGKLVQQTAAQAAGLPFGVFAQQIALLRVAHLVRTTGMRATDTVAPYHSRVRAAVLAHVDGKEAALHRRIALALEMSGHPDPEALTRHWREAGDLVKAAHFAVAAAEKAETALAFDRAVAFYQTAIELGPREDARELRVALAHALVNAGRSAEAGAMFLRAIDGASETDALVYKQLAAEQLLRAGHFEEALELFRTLQAAIGMPLAETPARALAGLLVSRARLWLGGLRFREHHARDVSPNDLRRIDTGFAIALGLSTIDTIRGADLQTRQLLAALSTGEPYRIARGIALEAAFNAAGGGSKAHARSARLVQTARDLAKRIDDPHALGLAAWAAGSSAYLEGRFAAASPLCEQAVSIYRERCRGVAWEVASSQVMSLWALSYLGSYREIGARLPALLKAAHAREDRYDSTNLRTSHTNTWWLAIDRPDEARTHLREAMKEWAPRTFQLPHYYELHGLVQHDLYVGDADAAWARVTAGWPQLKKALLLRLQIIRIEMSFLRARCALAMIAAHPAAPMGPLLASALDDAKLLEGEEAPWAVALAMQIRAGIAAARKLPTSVDLYDRAATALDAVDLRLHAAVCRYRRGALLGGSTGAAQIAHAETWMVSQDIRRPGQMAALLAPSEA